MLASHYSKCYDFKFPVTELFLMVTIDERMMNTKCELPQKRNKEIGPESKPVEARIILINIR